MSCYSKCFLENLNVASVPQLRHTKSLKPTIVESESSEDESEIYTPPKKVQRLYEAQQPNIMTSSNCVDADRMGVSIGQQHVVIQNTMKAMGVERPKISKTAVYDNRIKRR